MISDVEMLKLRFDYHKTLDARRWQYFATYVGFATLLVANIDKLSAARNSLVVAVAVMAILMAAVFLRLISRTRLRINENAQVINELARVRLVETGVPGSLGLSGISLWIYVSILLLAVPWIVLLVRINIFSAVVSALILGFELARLRWRLPRAEGALVGR